MEAASCPYGSLGGGPALYGLWRGAVEIHRREADVEKETRRAALG